MRLPVTPRLVDAILAVVAIEFVVIGGVLVHESAARWIAPWSFYLASGGFLLLALRAALSARGTRRIALALSMSGATHAAFLWWLLRESSGAPSTGGS